ncbi:APC family permease, partial [Gemmatimonadota bacterium]
VRARSGLVREFRTIDVLVFNIVAYAIGLVLVVTPTTLGAVYPQANISIILSLGLILCLFNGVTYSLIGAAMPRSGGDYVFTGRVLHPSVGFTANWGLTWSQFLGLGVYTGWCVTEALSPSLVTLGYVLDNPRMIDLGASLSNPINVVILGTLILLSVLAISLAGMHWLKRFLNTFFVFAMLGVALLLLVLLLANRNDFVTALNAFFANFGINSSYQAISEAGHTLGIQSPSNAIMPSLLALPLGYWVFLGFTFSVYIGGEVHQPDRAQIRGILGALLLGYFIYMLTFSQYYNVLGGTFINTISMLPEDMLEIFPAGTSMTFFVGLLAPNAITAFIINVSVFLWFYLLLFIMAQVCVRNVFAWAMDRLVPNALTKVSNKTASPTIAVTVILGFAWLFLLIHALAGIIILNYIALLSVCFLVAGIAAVAFPWKRPRDFSSAPNIVKFKVLGVPIIVIAGIGNIILFIIVLYSAITNPGLSGVEGITPIFTLVAIYGAGYIYYLIAARVRKRGNIDIEVLLEELPPE